MNPIPRQRGRPCFVFAYRARQKGCILLTFQEESEGSTVEDRIMAIPPDPPFVVKWRKAGGRVGTFEVNPCFFEQVLHSAGIATSDFRSVPPPRFVVNRRVEWLCELLIQETEHGYPSGRLYFESLATALVIAVASQTHPQLPEADNLEAQQRRIQRAVALVEAKFTDRLSCEEMARAACLSRFHFSRLFSRLMGFSPHEYLVRYRLEHAQKLLSSPEEERSLADVAAECGFADQAHLARRFRRAYGVSPSAFRREHR
jgi:AraC family transcriptional regulator